MDDLGAMPGGGGPLSHVDGAGRARMVDVTGKPWTHRRARACGSVRIGAVPGDLGTEAWDELLSAARVAGTQAAKRTAELVPLCHPLTVSRVEVRAWRGDGGVGVEAVAETVGPTGVEMEALTACAVAALTIAGGLRQALGPEVTDATLSVEGLALLEKTGGRSGAWSRPGPVPGGQAVTRPAPA